MIRLVILALLSAVTPAPSASPVPTATPTTISPTHQTFKCDNVGGCVVQISPTCILHVRSSAPVILWSTKQ